MCGGFSEIGGQPRTGRFAELNASDGSATLWNPEPAQYASASALYLSPAKVLYLGYYGKFGEDTSGTQYEGAAALQIAAEPEKPPTFLTSFHPNIGEVKGFYQLGETLYVGGRFNEVAFAPKDRETENYTVYERENLASFDIAKGYELLPFHPTPNGGEEYGNVGAITGGSGELYIAGYFGSVGGQPRTYLSELDPTTGEPLGSNPEIDGYVNAIAAAGSSVYVGGSFVTVHGAPRDHLAVINAGSGELEESDPGVDGTVDALATNGQTLYVGGEFRNAIGSKEPSFEGRNDLAAFSTSEGKLTSFNPEPNGTVGALAISGQTLFAGGGFNSSTKSLTERSPPSTRAPKRSKRSTPNRTAASPRSASAPESSTRPAASRNSKDSRVSPRETTSPPLNSRARRSTRPLRRRPSMAV